MLHPTVEKFIFDEAGKIRVAHVSYAGTAIFLLILTVCLCCCWKNVCFRVLFISKAEMVVNKIYTMCTTETFRLAREAKILDKELEKSWKELKRMEGVIAKKSELKKKLPATSQEEATSVSPVEKAPSAPPMEQQIVSCDVHKEPKTARFTTRSSRTPSSSSALDRN